MVLKCHCPCIKRSSPSHTHNCQIITVLALYLYQNTIVLILYSHYTSMYHLIHKVAWLPLSLYYTRIIVHVPSYTQSCRTTIFLTLYDHVAPHKHMTLYFMVMHHQNTIVFPLSNHVPPCTYNDYLHFRITVPPYANMTTYFILTYMMMYHLIHITIELKDSLTLYGHCPALALYISTYTS